MTRRAPQAPDAREVDPVPYFVEALRRGIAQFERETGWHTEMMHGIGTHCVRNGVMYDILPDGGLRIAGDSNGMTYEYDAATGKRCQVSQSGEYIGEWF